MFIRTTRKAHTIVSRFVSTTSKRHATKNHITSTKDLKCDSRVNGSKLVLPHDAIKNKKTISIIDLASLSVNLPTIVSTLFNNKGSHQSEKTYQRCLNIDLTEAGVDVEEEYKIFREYKGQRLPFPLRADLVLNMISGETAVIEVKAKKSLTANDLNQLTNYMDHLNIHVGFLINFPRDPGFPKSNREFNFKLLMGKCEVRLLNTSALCLRNDPRTTKTEPVVIQIDRRPLSSNEEKIPPLSLSILPQFGITKQGKPCKICIKKQDFCHFHEHQRPRGYFS